VNTLGPYARAGDGSMDRLHRRLSEDGGVASRRRQGSQTERRVVGWSHRRAIPPAHPRACSYASSLTARANISRCFQSEFSGKRIPEQKQNASMSRRVVADLKSERVKAGYVSVPSFFFTFPMSMP
jgi:hypothetical protein